MAKAVADALAKQSTENEEAKLNNQKLATAADEQAKADQLARAEAEEAFDNDPENHRYGNLDHKHEFDLKKLLPNMVKLPRDRFIIVKQAFQSLSDGSQFEDKTARRAQIIEPHTYHEGITPNKDTGKDSVYETLLGKFATVHQPY